MRGILYAMVVCCTRFEQFFQRLAFLPGSCFPLWRTFMIFLKHTRMTSILNWKGIKLNVQKYVAKCKVSQRSKYEAMLPTGLRQPLLIPSSVWKDISLDFISRLPKVIGVDTISVVIDKTTKYSHFIALRHPYTTKEVATVFTKVIVKLHGYLCSIISFRNQLFLSNFQTGIFKLVCTKLMFNFAYHPQLTG